MPGRDASQAEARWSEVSVQSCTSERYSSQGAPPRYKGRNVAEVIVYQHQVYDIRDDGIVKSKRWGTRNAIAENACDQVLENTAIDVDESAIRSEIHEFMGIGFDPRPRLSGFQMQVKS
jgi:hypothetical protein